MTIATSKIISFGFTFGIVVYRLRTLLFGRRSLILTKALFLSIVFVSVSNFSEAQHSAPLISPDRAQLPGDIAFYYEVDAPRLISSEQYFLELSCSVGGNYGQRWLRDEYLNGLDKKGAFKPSRANNNLFGGANVAAFFATLGNSPITYTSNGTGGFNVALGSNAINTSKIAEVDQLIIPLFFLQRGSSNIDKSTSCNRDFMVTGRNSSDLELQPILFVSTKDQRGTEESVVTAFLSFTDAVLKHGGHFITGGSLLDGITNAALDELLKTADDDEAEEIRTRRSGDNIAFEGLVKAWDTLRKSIGADTALTPPAIQLREGRNILKTSYGEIQFKISKVDKKNSGFILSNAPFSANAQELLPVSLIGSTETDGGHGYYFSNRNEIRSFEFLDSTKSQVLSDECFRYAQEIGSSVLSSLDRAYLLARVVSKDRLGLAGSVRCFVAANEFDSQMLEALFSLDPTKSYVSDYITPSTVFTRSQYSQAVREIGEFVNRSGSVEVERHSELAENLLKGKILPTWRSQNSIDTRTFQSAFERSVQVIDRTGEFRSAVIDGLSPLGFRQKLLDAGYVRAGCIFAYNDAQAEQFGTLLNRSGVGAIFAIHNAALSDEYLDPTDSRIVQVFVSSVSKQIYRIVISNSDARPLFSGGNRCEQALAPKKRKLDTSNTVSDFVATFQPVIVDKVATTAVQDRFSATLSEKITLSDPASILLPDGVKFLNEEWVSVLSELVSGVGIELRGVSCPITIENAGLVPPGYFGSGSAIVVGHSDWNFPSSNDAVVLQLAFHYETGEIDFVRVPPDLDPTPVLHECGIAATTPSG